MKRKAPTPPNRKRPSARKENRHSEKKHYARFYVVFFGLCVVLAMVVLKLFYIQVIDSHNLRAKAQKSRHQSVRLYNRGRILDRNGVVLAQDTMVYDIYAHKDYYYGVTPKQIAAVLSPVLNMNFKKLTKKLSAPFSTVSVKKNVPKDLVTKIKDLKLQIPRVDSKTKEVVLDEAGNVLTKKVKLPGLDFAKKPIRNYPQGNLASHVLGYVNDEADISSGVELTASHILRKEPKNLIKMPLTGRGDMMNLANVSPESLAKLPEAEDVVLTIDAKLQFVAEKALHEGIERAKASGGTVIMMQPTTGEILAFASEPNYLPDQYFKASATELKNWALSDVYPPGSTFKIITVATGLETGVINTDSKINDTGTMTVGGWPIRNYDYATRGAPGMIDLTYLLQHSSNIGSAKIALMIPQSKYKTVLKGFGIGKKTGIDLPGESSGIFHEDNRWDQSTHASLGYGYGIGATPIQMAAAISAIANDGIWITPHVLKDRQDIKKRRVLKPETAEKVTALLKKSIETAHTSTVRLDHVTLAGKTGTSRKPSKDGRGYSGDLYTSFVGYFPADKPEVLVMVVIDSPKMAASWGSTVAGPIFKTIGEEAVSYLAIKADK